MIDFKSKDLYNILEVLEQKIETLKSKEILEFKIQNPDYKALVDIAQIYYCKMLNPIIEDEKSIIVRFEKLNNNDTFHKEKDSKEKYGVESTFGTIDKTQQPSFLYYYKQALKNVSVEKRLRVLNLGVNSGDEFEILKKYSKNFSNQELIGIDYCPSAIKKANDKFQDKNITFIEVDINELDRLDLGQFDLIITIGTLQSSNIEFNIFFQDLVQKYLKKDGAMILGFPNCRWVDGEMVYGAKAKNYSFSESSLVFKDVVFCKKYLQQKRFRVTITGKDYIFLTATSIRK